MTNGLAPDIWGKHGWALIHYVALGYPDNPSMIDITNYKNWYINIGNVLPCETCKKHYNNLISLNPPNTSNRDSLFKWTVDIHNNVNKKLDKPIILYQDAIDIWKNNKPKNNIHDFDSLNLYILILSCIAFIILYKITT